MADEKSVRSVGALAGSVGAGRHAGGHCGKGADQEGTNVSGGLRSFKHRESPFVRALYEAAPEPPLNGPFSRRSAAVAL